MNRRMSGIGLILVLTVILGCANSKSGPSPVEVKQPTTTLPSPEPSQPTQNTPSTPTPSPALRTRDWQNSHYLRLGGRLTDGLWEQRVYLPPAPKGTPRKCMHYTMRVKLTEVLHADLVGTPQEEALVVLTRHSYACEPTAKVSGELVLFALEDGKVNEVRSQYIRGEITQVRTVAGEIQIDSTHAEKTCRQTWRVSEKGFVKGSEACPPK